MARCSFEANWFGGTLNPNVYQIPIVLGNNGDEIIIRDNSSSLIWSLAYPNGETNATAVYLTTSDYATTTYGSKTLPGVVFTGTDSSGDLGYENASLSDGISFLSGDGDLGNPLFVVPEPDAVALATLALGIALLRRSRR